MSTNALKAKEIKREWKSFDAKNQTLGRLAVKVANTLMGKGKTNYVTYLDLGDYVVVTNASLVKVTGKKESQKKYYRHSGFPGGLKTETLSALRARRPEEVIRHAVWGMLPKNRLGRAMVRKLHIYSGSEHPYEKQVMKESNGPKESKVMEEAAQAVA